MIHQLPTSLIKLSYQNKEYYSSSIVYQKKRSDVKKSLMPGADKKHVPCFPAPPSVRQCVLYVTRCISKKESCFLLFCSYAPLPSQRRCLTTKGRSSAALAAEWRSKIVRNSLFFCLHLVTYKTHCRTEGGAGKQGTCFLSAPSQSSGGIIRIPPARSKDGSNSGTAPLSGIRS